MATNIENRSNSDLQAAVRLLQAKGNPSEKKTPEEFVFINS